MSHPMQCHILLDSTYRQTALAALLTIRKAFQARAITLRNAYNEHQIDHSTLMMASKTLMQEASRVLDTFPGDTPEKILFDLGQYASFYSQQSETFSLSEFIASLSSGPSIK